MLEVSLQQIFALIPATLNRYLEFVKEILFQTLCSLKEAYFHVTMTFEASAPFLSHTDATSSLGWCIWLH